MEQILKELFDYQRFQGNIKLKILIADTESRYITELSDEEMGAVSAAGSPELSDRKKER